MASLGAGPVTSDNWGGVIHNAVANVLQGVKRASTRPADAGAARRRLPWAVLCAAGLVGVSGFGFSPIPVSVMAEQDAPEVQIAALDDDVAAVFQDLTGQPGNLAFRTEAALRLIEIGGSDAELALAASLGPAYQSEVWHATLVALGTTRTEPPRGDLPDVLVGMRRRMPADIEIDWAAALGRYELQRISEELEVIARDQRAPLEQRRLAIIAIGHHRRAFAADVLIDLIDPRQRGEVQGWAFAALATLSHQPHLGRDRAAWEQWWETARGWNRTEWQRAMHENLLLLTAEQRAMDRRLRDRLVESQRQLYRATGAEDKPAVLAGMLGDALEPIRDLGMDLARRRLEDGETFPESVRAALRSALRDDDAPQVREQAATLLGQLSDEQGVEIMAGRLARGEETATSVQRQYLLALRRLPREGAVEPAYAMLGDRALQTEAAGALAAAAQAGLMDSDMRRRVRERVLEGLTDVQIPQADMVLLLGRVLSENDREWSRVEGWLDSSDDQVRHSAANVWAGAGRPLEVLARRSDDPVIRPIALRAIIERGDQPATLLAIALKRPEEAADLQLWNQALVAMAARVPAGRVLSTLDELAQNPADTRAVRLDMLTQAIEREDKPDPADAPYVRLLLARAQMLFEDDAADRAILDYQAALDKADILPADERPQVYRGLTAAYLTEQNADAAFATARLLLVDAEGNPRPAADDEPLIQACIDAIARANDAGNKDFARAVLAQLRELLGTGITAELGQQLTDLERQVNADPPPDAG